MTTPTPPQVADDAVAVALLAGEVARAFAWLHDDGFAGAGGRVAEDGSNNGPVPAAVIHRRAVRDKLGYAGRAVARARGQLAGALGALHEAAELVDEAARHLVDDEHDRRIPRSVTVLELEQFQRAQGRRIARGESPPPARRAA